MAKDTKQQSQQPAQQDGTIRIQYYRSAIGFAKTQKEVVRSVGLTKLNQIVERPDTPAMRGYVRKVPHLLRIVD
ncbi:MAG: 50S ribosomal protein L30 [Pyrinomonadaceae bacterium]